MRVLFYISTICGGGAARVMVNLANEFAVDNEVHFVTNFLSEHEYVLNKKVHRHSIEQSESNNNVVRKNITRIRILRKLIKNIEPNISVAFMRENNFRLIFAARCLQPKTLIYIRNDPAREYAGWLSRNMADILFKKADGVVFQTEEAQKFFSSKIQKKSRIIFNQVDSKFYQMINEPGKHMIACGRLSKQKNYTMMLEAFKLVLEQYPDEKLHIYGEGDLKDELQQYAKILGIEASVRFMGFSENMVRNYRSAKLLLMTSDYEGMPNVILEALASSVPVVSTDCPCGGPRMVIENGVNGFLNKTGDVQMFADSIIYLLSHVNELNSMKEKAYYSAKQFAGERVMKEWNNYIAQIVFGDIE